MKRVLCGAALALFLVGCSDNVLPTRPLAAPSSSYDISDGGHGGNASFFFLPPLAPRTSFAGEFDPNVRPAVEICELGDGPAPACEMTVRTFGGQDIKVERRERHYEVVWHTGPDHLDPARVYRITVRVGGMVLGYRDVEPERHGGSSNGNGWGWGFGGSYGGSHGAGPSWFGGGAWGGPHGHDDRATSGGPDIYRFRNGSSIPIKFRIEKGALCDTGAMECNVAVIYDSVGGTVPIASGGVYFSPYSLPGYDAITVIAERVDNLLAPGEECVPGLDLPQFGPCIRIRTEPELADPLLKDAVVSVCVDPGKLPLSETQADLLHVFKWDEQDPGTVQELPNVPEAICSQTVGLRQDRSLFSRALAAVSSFFVQPAYAVHTGLGSLTKSFSRFRWALPARFSVLDGDGQAAAPGSTVAVAPAVLVQDENGDPVKDARVHWDVAAGGGSVEPLTVYSDSAGVARVDRWTLGPDYTANTVDAWGFGISDGPEPYGSPQASLTEPVVVDTGHVRFSARGCKPIFDTSFGVDGVMSPGEWDCAAHDDFTVNLPGGTTAPATVYWKNDGANLYLAVRVDAGAGNLDAALRFDFDNNGDGVADAGDDAFGITSGSGFFDDFLTAACAQGSTPGCGASDVSDGGATNGRGAIGGDAGHVVFELAHPLASGDTGHDFQLAPGDTPGFYLSLSFGQGGDAVTLWPGFRTWRHMGVAGP